MIKVLFLTPNLGGGGAEKVLVNLVNNMDKSKFDITVETIFNGGVNADRLTPDVKYVCRKKKLFPGVTRVYACFSSKVLYKNIVGKEKYDVVVAYMHGIPTKVLLGAPKGVKRIAWLHTGEMSKMCLFKSFPSRKSAIKAMRQYDAIVGVAQTVTDNFSAYTGIKDNLYTCYNTNEIEKILQQAQETVVLPEMKKPIICSVGRFTSEKGFSRLIDISYRLNKEGISHSLILIGDGVLRADMEKKVADITLIGGGNMDDKYQSLEDARLFVVQQFPKNKMISFPQTVCFSDTKKGQKSLKRSRRIYSKHEDLTMFMRENNAFLRAKTYFPKVNVMPCPDIVLYLNETTPKTERTNILCCLRKDKEQNISNEAREELISYMTKNYENVLCKDTVDVALEDCRPDTYEKTLKEFWATLRTCKLVVTDRLHCMIFCAITETPCIVMDNTNKKISGVCRQWLSGADWIKMVEGCDRQTIVELADEMLGKESVCKSVNLEEAFKPLKQVCRNN